MSATAATVYHCTQLDALNNCAQWDEIYMAVIPAEHVPTINQFLVVLGDALYNPTPAGILYVFTWGAGAILLPWSIGYAVGVAKRSIRAF